MPAAEQPIEPAILSAKEGFRFTKRHYAAVFLVFAVIVFLAFQVFLSERYKNDSYSHLTQSQFEIAGKHLGGYRYMPALNMLLYSLANVRDVDAQLLNTACLLVCLALSATILFLSLCKRLSSLSASKLLLVAAAVLLVYVNPFIAAMALFPETGMFMGAGYLFVTLAAVFIAKKFSVANGLISFALLSAALGTYQAFLGIYALAVFSLWIAEFGLSVNREMIKRALILVLITGLSSIANILIGKALCSLFSVAENVRTAGFSVQRVLSNLLALLHEQLRLWYDLLHTTPRFLGMLICAFLMLCVISNFLIKSVRKVRSKEISVSKLIADTLFWCLVFAFCYATVFAPFMLATSASLIPRGILSFFGVFLLLAIMLIAATDSSWQHWSAAATIGILLLICVSATTRIGVEQNMVNALDREYARQVIYYINSYEKGTGASVTKIAVVNDENPTNYYESVECYSAPYAVLNKSARVVNNSQVNFIKMYSGRDLERISMPEDMMAAHFEGKNWDFFVPSEQIFFEGDTVYIVTY